MAVRKMREADLIGDTTVPQSEDSHESEGGSDDGGGCSRDAAGWREEGKDEDGGGGTMDGWADAMAKILGKKNLTGGSNILVKSKEVEKMKAAERQEQEKRQKQVDKRQRWEMMFRDKPDVIKDRETEKALQRIATRGVVQLFNAVRKHQKTVDEVVKDAGGSERKKAKILSSFSKKDFISALRREDRAGKTWGAAQDEATPAAENKPSWSVLRDDFMMGASMKDWDRDSDGNEHRGGRLDSDSD